jgi:Zn-finger protein
MTAAFFERACFCPVFAAENFKILRFLQKAAGIFVENAVDVSTPFH